ncbi:MAG: hypothetical protein K2Q97_14025, partial [Burkholderiaceae bacterium]|nr:hypothetical protein [Burkholderiaceae bacterium]
MRSGKRTEKLRTTLVLQWILVIAAGSAGCAPALARNHAALVISSPGVSKATADASAMSPQATQVHAWIVQSANSQDMPFVIIDKKAAQLHVFDGRGALTASSPVLLGLAVGDQSIPGIGERKMSEIQPHERTTPAGRFVSEPGKNLGGEDIVWIEYDTAISMHRVRANNASERRLKRLASPTASDNRISYGCVNVPARFY